MATRSNEKPYESIEWRREGKVSQSIARQCSGIAWRSGAKNREGMAQSGRAKALHRVARQGHETRSKGTARLAPQGQCKAL